MGKLDSMMKCAQARNLMNEKQYQKAFEAIEKIDPQKVKSIIDLRIMGEVYISVKEYAKARDIYFLIYDKVKSRSVLFHLIFLSIKCSMLEEAVDFYEEYKKLDNNSVDCYILKFYLEKAKGAERSKQMECVKQILSIEYLEEWAYELAKLYHKEGMEQECVEECSKIILWFGEGVIVEKAMLLKLHYVEGLDISSAKAIEETRNLAEELRMAAAIARQQDIERYERENRIPETDDFMEGWDESGAQAEIEEPAENILEALGNNKIEETIACIVNETAETKEMPHLSVMGSEMEKMLSVIKQLMKELFDAGAFISPRIARISAKKLNEIYLEDKKEQLRGSCLLIEDAHELSLDSLRSLYLLMGNMKSELIIALFDTKEQMEGLLNKNRKLKSCIKYEIYI